MIASRFRIISRLMVLNRLIFKPPFRHSASRARFFSSVKEKKNEIF